MWAGGHKDARSRASAHLGRPYDHFCGFFVLIWVLKSGRANVAKIPLNQKTSQTAMQGASESDDDGFCDDAECLASSVSDCPCRSHYSCYDCYQKASRRRCQDGHVHLCDFLSQNWRSSRTRKTQTSIRYAGVATPTPRAVRLLCSRIVVYCHRLLAPSSLKLEDLFAMHVRMRSCGSTPPCVFVQA